jgi:hypothetical protein
MDGEQLMAAADRALYGEKSRIGIQKGTLADA